MLFETRATKKTGTGSSGRQSKLFFVRIPSYRYNICINVEPTSSFQDAEKEADALFALVEGAQLVARSHTDVSKFTDATALFAARLRKE